MIYMRQGSSICLELTPRKMMKTVVFLLLFFGFFLRYAGLSPLWPLPLRSTGSGRAGSATTAHGPSSSAVCGILPDRGTNPRPLHRQADSQPLRHQGSPLTPLMFSNPADPSPRAINTHIFLPFKNKTIRTTIIFFLDKGFSKMFSI